MPLTEDDLKAIAGLIDTKLEASKPPEGAVTAEQVGKIVAEQLGSLKLDEKITAAVDAAKPKTKGDDEDKTKQRGESSDEYAARMKALEEKQAAAEERERAAIAREREERLRGELGRALEAQGIPRDRHEQAIAYLRTKTSNHSGKPVFDFDDNGAPIFRKAGKGYDDSLTIEAGIKDWASTDEAKLYKPPADRRGTGTGEGRGRAPSSGGNETSVNEILGRIEL